MRNLELHLEQALNRYYEAEAMATLIQEWAERYTEGDKGDQILKHSFALLEDAMTETFRAICECKGEITRAKIAQIEAHRLAQTTKGGDDE